VSYFARQRNLHAPRFRNCSLFPSRPRLSVPVSSCPYVVRAVGVAAIDARAGEDHHRHRHWRRHRRCLRRRARAPQSGVEILGISTTFGDTETRARLVDRLLAETGRSGIPVVAVRRRRSTASSRSAAMRKADSSRPPRMPTLLLSFSIGFAAIPRKSLWWRSARWSTLAHSSTRSRDIRQAAPRGADGGSIERGYGTSVTRPRMAPIRSGTSRTTYPRPASCSPPACPYS